MELKIKYQQYSTSELNLSDGELLAAARLRAKSAKARYSNFRVGAAARLSSGEIVSAANIESEVFPAGICAERALLFFVQSNYTGQKIVDMVITSISSAEECYPCGACRQAILDAEREQGAPIRVIMAGAESVTIVESGTLLLPFSFVLDN